MFETYAIDSILKDAKEMREITKNTIPKHSTEAWRRIQKHIMDAANRGQFYTCIPSVDYLQISYKELAKGLKKKGYRLAPLSKLDYRNGLSIIVKW